MRKSKRFALSMVMLFSFVSSAVALAKGACNAVDLRGQLGPARLQSGTNWCHSFTAADLLSAKLAYQVSAADIARSYHSNKGVFAGIANALAGNSEKDFVGTSHGALKAALTSGVCSERNFPFELIRDNLGTNVERMSKEMCDSYRMDLRGHFDIGSRTVAYGDGQAEKVLQDQLSIGNIVAIDFNVFRLLNAWGKEQHPLGLSGHASNVVGMRPGAKGGCEYLVRGSWGPTCHSYDSSLDCEEGNVWVPGSDLSYMVFSLNWLERLK